MQKLLTRILSPFRFVAAGEAKENSQRELGEGRRAEETNPFPAFIGGSSDDAIFDTTVDGIITSWNQGAASLYGYPPDEVIGRSVSIFAPSDRPDEVPGILARIKQGERISHFETVRLRKDGTPFNVSLTILPIKNTAAEVAGATAIARDISERKRAENELRLMQFSVEHTSEFVTWVDSQGRILYANNALCCSLGRSREELLSLSIWDIDPDLSAECWEATLQKLKARGSLAFDSHKQTKLGRVFPVEVAASYVKYGEEEYCFAFSRDITERKRVEQELRLTQFSVEHASDAVFWMNPEGRIVYANEAACRSLGWSREELLSLTIPDIDPLYSQEAWEAVRKEAKIHGSKTFETQHRSKEGRVFPVEVSARYLEFCGKEYHFTLVRDITERKQAEAAMLRAKEAAEAANRAKSEFLANMSHEIRTPLNAIIGLTDLVLDTDLSPEQQEDLNTVRASANSLLRIVNDILDFSKMGAKKLDLERIQFDLRESLVATLKAQRVRASHKNLDLDFRCAPDVPPAVLGDPGRLCQVLTNLVDNAVKFTERGKVEVGVEKQSATGEDITLHFSVRDTGIGVPPEKKHSIFDAFVQADTSHTRRFGGTGLGLTIASQLVGLMGGEIWLESEVGQGSTFHFTVRFGTVELITGEVDRRNTTSEVDELLPHQGSMHACKQQGPEPDTPLRSYSRGRSTPTENPRNKTVVQELGLNLHIETS